MRLVIVAFGAALALALTCAGASALSSGDAQAQALLAKHRAFVGWQFGDGTFNTMRITGDVTDEKGEKIGSFVDLSSGLLYNNTYVDLKQDSVTTRDGFTGNLFWQTDNSGFTTPVYGDYAKFLASFSVLKHEGTTELQNSFIGNKTVDGKSVGVVRVTLAHGDPIDLYVDPATGAYVKAVIDPDGAYETTYHIRSYQDVLPGKKMMASFTVDDDKPVFAYTKFDPNAAITGADLHPPAPTAYWTFGGGAPFPITVTHFRLLVDATVNGVKGRFILDTGADSIYLDDRFADRANAAPLHGSGTAYSLYGEVKTRLRNVKTMTFGDATVHDVIALSQNFEKDSYRGLDASGYDGLIGFDLFAGAIVRLNVYDATMAILDPTSDLSAEKGLPVTVDLSQGVPAIPMILNKTIAANALLDTGNPGIIFFGPDLIKKHNFKVVGGCGWIDSLAIGPIVYAGESACQYGMAASDMLLGFDFLKHFDFVFDYPHGRMFLRPNKN
jgi:hypothetical protein